MSRIAFLNRWATPLAVLALVGAFAGQAWAQGLGYGQSTPGFDNFQGQFPPGEAPEKAIDDTLFTGDPPNESASKYLNFGAPETIVGLVVTPSTPNTIVRGVRFATANDAPGRDPITFLLEGSNTGTGPTAVFVPIASGQTGLASVTDRYMYGAAQNFVNAVGYNAYRITFPTIRALTPSGENNSMQIGEIELLNAAGVDVTNPGDPVIGVHLVPEPGSMALVTLGALALLRRRR
jgi:hypothetical protein